METSWACRHSPGPAGGTRRKIGKQVTQRLRPKAWFSTTAEVNALAVAHGSKAMASLTAAFRSIERPRTR